MTGEMKILCSRLKLLISRLDKCPGDIVDGEKTVRTCGTEQCDDCWVEFLTRKGDY